jgi:ATP-dependent RNA helicase RhlE
MRFEELGLLPALLRALEAEGYDHPTPIQTQAIPHLLGGRDLFGCAQTGTGKTAAFALPVLQRLATEPATRGRRPIRTLVLAPTRELAAQIAERFTAYGHFLHPAQRVAVIFGGVGKQPQIDALRRGVDILVATPGRLLDLMGDGHVGLEHVEIFILDEADRMLDMGFIHDVRKVIAAVPPVRQTLLFSATMPAEIMNLAQTILRDPLRVEVTPVATTAEKVDQVLFFVEKNDKRRLLSWLLEDPDFSRTLVFTRTKHGANRVAEHLEKTGVGAAAIHGNKSQNARERALEHFRSGANRVLVATDIAARGLDIDDVSHVINFDLPNEPETYVHRIGRTARAGASGAAVSFCEMEERPYLVDIERLTRQHIPRITEHPFASPTPPPAPTDLDPKGRGSAPRTAPRTAPARPSAPPRIGPPPPRRPRGADEFAPPRATGGSASGPSAPRPAAGRPVPSGTPAAAPAPPAPPANPASPATASATPPRRRHGETASAPSSARRPAPGRSRDPVDLSRCTGRSLRATLGAS